MDVAYHNPFQTATGRFLSENMDSVHICRHFYSDYRLHGYFVFLREFAGLSCIALVESAAGGDNYLSNPITQRSPE